jgi:menaquinone-9 beta-reductase
MRDAIVVGAGPAGSSVALRLARMGCDVALLERSQFPRLKVCGDYLCAGAIEQLEKLDIAAAVLDGANVVSGITLHGFGERMRLPLPGDGAVSLPREILDTRLRQAALTAGAQPVQGSFLRATQDSKAVRVSYRNPQGAQSVLESRVLVGADGARSVVARRCGLARQHQSAGRWAVGGRLSAQGTSTELEMFVAKQGYYARNPLGPGLTNSMLVLAAPPTPSQADEIVACISDSQRRFEPEKIDRVVAIGPLSYRATSVMRGNVLLTGDAAELLDPFTGQGVATALALSAPAANAVFDLLAGAPRASVERSYRRKFKSIVAPRRALGALIRTMVGVEFVRRRCVQALREDRALLRQLIEAVSGIAPPKTVLQPRVLWRLLVA